jgi:hypothetical protein
MNPFFLKTWIGTRIYNIFFQEYLSYCRLYWMRTNPATTWCNTECGSMWYSTQLNININISLALPPDTCTASLITMQCTFIREFPFRKETKVVHLNRKDYRLSVNLPQDTIGIKLSSPIFFSGADKTTETSRVPPIGSRTTDSNPSNLLNPLICHWIKFYLLHLKQTKLN